MICVICLEEGTNINLSCSHKFHLDCLQRHFKQTCPLCRAPHNIEVFGEVPRDNIDYSGQGLSILETFGIDEYGTNFGKPICGTRIWDEVRREILNGNS